MQDETFIQVLASVAKEHSDRPALWVRGRQYSYAELWALASIVASIPMEEDGPFCALVSGKSFVGYAAIVGIMLAGKTYLPLSPDHADEAAAYKLTHSGCKLVLTDIAGMETAIRYLKSTGRSGRVIAIDPGGTPHQVAVDGDLVTHAPSPEGACSLFFTSGSTGKPKAILTRQSAMVAYADAIRDAFVPAPSDRVSQLAGLSFDFSMHDIIVAWTSGACLYAVTQEDGFHLPSFVREHEISIWSSVPSTLLLLDQLHGCGPDAYPSVRLSLVGGEVVPPQLAAKWMQAAPNQVFYNIYGPTEAAMVVTACRWDERFLGEGSIPIGWPLGQTRILVLNEELSPVSPGEEGQIALGGPQVAQGYYNDPRRTTESFVTPIGQHGIWYLTGDRGCFDPKYGFRFRGRRDCQLKIRGHRLEREDAEQLLRRAALTEDVAVIGWPVSEHGILIGVVAFVNGSPLTRDEIRRRSRAIMPRFAWPSRFVLGPIPRNVNKKVDYAALPDMLKEREQC